MIAAKAVAKYVLLPQVMPRIQALIYSGFSYLAMFMAQIYGSVRLLPSDHPYLNSANMGRFGVRHVIAEAARNLVFKKENLDQIVIFGMLLVGFVILVAQVFLLLIATFASTAHAVSLPAPFDTYNYADFFITPNAQDDIAFVLMDRVFGLQDFFVDSGGGQTCVAQGISCFGTTQTPDRTIYTNYDRTASTALPYPWPFHEALRSMLQLYSVGILIIAVFIFLYFIVAMIAETAQSGTPFGKRFNHVWAPLRMVVAMGLLIPVNQGLNSAQWILMYSAYWGSGFATNGWILFNTEAVSGGSTLLGEPDTLVSTPLAPPMNTLLEFMSMAATCKESYERLYHEIERPDGATRDAVEIDAYLVDSRNIAMGAPPTLIGTANYTDAQEMFNFGDIRVVIGEYRGTDGNEYMNYDGRVIPYCGEIRFAATDRGDAAVSPGSWTINRQYYAELRNMWQDASSGGFAGCGYGTAFIIGCIGFNTTERHVAIDHDENAPLPNAADIRAMVDAYVARIANAIDLGVTHQQGSPHWLEDLTSLGWAGAAIWYNRVAELNGNISAAAYNIPSVQKYPLLLETIQDSRTAADADVTGEERFRMYQGPDEAMALSSPVDQQIANAMYHAQDLWSDVYSNEEVSANIFIDAINAVFGTSGLFNIHANADAGIHPLAQLVAIGKSIIESSVRNLGYSAGAGLGGGLMNIFGLHLVGNVAMAASSFLLQVATIGLTIGFVLFYIIPFLPFIYFFFAVGGWIKGIFEAMVGVPLWALAHIRIDGNGLPGDAAMGGYYLILEIFLRPILIIFGFLASIVIFGAQAQILHEIWPLVVSNAVGYDEGNLAADPNATGGLRYLRGAVDNLFFTVIYAIIVYMLGMASFKMIDLVPNHILRWMGASVSTFGDQSGDPAQNLVRNSFMGSSMLSGPAQQVMQGGGQAVSSAGKGIGSLFSRSQ